MREKDWERENISFCSGSVLLQDQVLQLVCWAQQEGRRLPVSCDELPHRRHLGRAELGWSTSAATTSLSVTVGAGGGGGGIWANWLHAQICRTCGEKSDDLKIMCSAGGSSEVFLYWTLCNGNKHDLSKRIRKQNFPSVVSGCTCYLITDWLVSMLEAGHYFHHFSIVAF